MTTPTRSFANDDDAAQHWLTLLREGAPEQKITARQELASIFERRDMLEEATDLLEANGRDGVRTVELFSRLASLYLRTGRHDDATAARSEAAKLPRPSSLPPEASLSAVGPVPIQQPRKRSKLRLVGLGSLGCGGLGVLGLVALMAIGSQLPKPAVTPVATAISAPVAPTTAPITGVAVAAPPTGAPVPPAEPTAAPQPAPAAPEPTLRPVMATAAARTASKPTAVPAPPPLAIAFTGEFEPRVLRVGQKLVIKLGVENKSDRPIEGLRIFTTGPWDKYTVVSVVPNGRFESGMIGYNVYSGMTVPPGQTRFVNIVANPNEPGNHDFSFIPNQDMTQLKDEKGEGIVIGGKVAVTR